MPQNDEKEVVEKKEITLLSVEKLRAKTEEQEKRIKDLETQVSDLIKELASNSSKAQGTDNQDTGSTTSKNEKLQKKMDEVFRK